MKKIIRELLVCNLFGSFPAEIRNQPPYMKGRERPKKRADHTRLAGSRFNKQGNLVTRLVLGNSKMSSFVHPATKF